MKNSFRKHKQHCHHHKSHMVAPSTLFSHLVVSMTEIIPHCIISELMNIRRKPKMTHSKDFTYHTVLNSKSRKFQLSQINLKNLCPFNPLRFAVECWNQREIQHSNASHNPRFIQSKPSLKNLLFEETKKGKTINQRLHIAYHTGNKFSVYQINHKGE